MFITGSSLYSPERVYENTSPCSLARRFCGPHYIDGCCWINQYTLIPTTILLTPLLTPLLTHSLNTPTTTSSTTSSSSISSSSSSSSSHEYHQQERPQSSRNENEEIHHRGSVAPLLHWGLLDHHWGQGLWPQWLHLQASWGKAYSLCGRMWFNCSV